MKKVIKIGNLYIGGDHDIKIQSMTTTETKDVKATVKEIKELERVGCEIIRVAVLDLKDAKAIKEIKKEINIPLVADIHFDYRLAIASIESGADKIRLNPGNLKKKEHVEAVVKLCKEKKIPIRIGVNTGSLPKDLPKTAEGMIEAAKRHVQILEELDFKDIVLSFKASDIDLAYEAYRLADQEFDYPLHIGITEAGTLISGIVKSTIGIAKILGSGIGDTIRISLSSDPKDEVITAKELLKNLKLKHDVPTLISCPTCGRCEYNMLNIANRVKEYLDTINCDIKVAVMGCAVNGPGEAMDADIGIAGGKGEALLFKKGKIIRKIKEAELYETLIKEIEKIRGIS